MIKHIVEVYDPQTGGFKEAIYLDSKSEADAKIVELQNNGADCEYIGPITIDDGVAEFLREDV